MQSSSIERTQPGLPPKGTTRVRPQASRQWSSRGLGSQLADNLFHHRIRIALVLCNFRGELRKVFAGKHALRLFQQGVSQHLDQTRFPVLSTAPSKQVFARHITLVSLYGVRELLHASTAGRDGLDDRRRPVVL